MKRILVILFLLTATNSFAAPPSRVNKYTVGSTILASDVTGNEDAIFNYLQAGVDTIADGTIVNADVNGSAGIVASKLNLATISQNISNTGTLANTGRVTFTNASTANLNLAGDPTNGSPSDGDLWFTGSALNFRNGSVTRNILGGVVQIVNSQDGAVATGTTQLPFDDTIPQNTEGDQYLSLAITPTSSSNTLKIEVVFYGTSSLDNSNLTAALFQDTTANALAAGVSYNDTTTSIESPVAFTHYMSAGTTSETTFKVRAGADGAGTTTFNGVGGSRRLGGVLASSITITEYES